LLGVSGQVIEIELFSTTLLHTDTSRVVVPNRKIVGEILHNYGKIRQLELSVGIAYGSDLGAALAAVRSVLEQNPRVLKDPAAFIGVSALGDSFVSLSIKPWVGVDDFVFAPTEIYQAVVASLEKEKIEIPGPRRAIRLINQ